MTGPGDKAAAAAFAAARRAVLRAFWHRTRRMWVPLTSAEILRRAGGDEASVKSVLVKLQYEGLVVRTSAGTSAVPAVYELTDKGVGVFAAKGATP